jgi:hypothetical protein
VKESAYWQVNETAMWAPAKVAAVSACNLDAVPPVWPKGPITKATRSGAVSGTDEVSVQEAEPTEPFVNSVQERTGATAPLSGDVSSLTICTVVEPFPGAAKNPFATRFVATQLVGTMIPTEAGKGVGEDTPEAPK